MTVLTAGVALGGAWVAREVALTADQSILVTIDEDYGSSPPIAAQPSGRQPADSDIVPPGDQFEHARPSPRLFERVSASEAERIKSSVRDQVVADGPEDWYSGNGRTFQTVCVRLCDGAYFPVSFSTTRDRFARDQAVCQSRCSAPARLFVFPNPGGSPETMRDLSGKSYAALPAAFQFRKGPTSGCSCRAEPWEQASIDRHRSYAMGPSAGTPPATSRVASLETASATRVAGWQSTEVKPTVGEHRSVPGSVTTKLDGAQTRPMALATGSIPNDATSTHVTSTYITATRGAPPPGQPVVASPVQIEAESVPWRQRRMVEVDVPLPVMKPQLAKQARVAIKGTRKRNKPSRPDGGTTLVTAFAEDAGAAVAPTLKQRRNWGFGPNSALAPRGNSAYDVFARNFY